MIFVQSIIMIMTSSALYIFIFARKVQILLWTDHWSEIPIIRSCSTFQLFNISSAYAI